LQLPLPPPFPRSKKTDYKGVYRTTSGLYQVLMKIDQQPFHLGTFHTTGKAVRTFLSSSFIAVGCWLLKQKWQSNIY
jgi:hypothetical protein